MTQSGGPQSAWRELLSRPELEPDVRTALAERVVRWTVGPLWLLLLGTTLSVLLSSGLGAPTRLVPIAIVGSMLTRVTLSMRERRWLRAAATLCAAIWLGICTGVLLNGVHAPVLAGGPVLIALVIQIFGPRWALRAGLSVIAAALSAYALERAGLSLIVPPPNAAMRVGFHSAYMAFAFMLHAAAQRLLNDALSDARRERREADQARITEAAAELAFHAVFDQASVGMLLLTAAGAIERLNDCARQLLSVDASLVGQPLEAAALWSPEQKLLLREAVADAASGHKRIHDLALTGQHGAFIMYQLRISPFHDRQGAVGHVLVELVDVTDLVATRAMLAQARRLEALGTLSGGVAHDINNMLTAIVGGGELVREGRRGARLDLVDSGLEVVESSVRRASALTRQLLAFGRQDRFDSTDIDLNQLVLEMGHLFERTLRKNVSVKIVPAGEAACVRGDVAALENALLNLALNAQDAMPAGGTLRIEVQRLEVDEALRQQLNDQIATGPAVLLRVEDTGCGMSESVRERIFEPFFTTKTTGRGTGLGLAAVHGTVRNHSGAITVHTEEGVGSCFELYLPAIAAVQSAPRPSHIAARPPALQARVLLADDEPLVRRLLVMMLRTAGCEVEQVADGEALMAALGTGAAPDIIVTDLVMPGLSGNALIQTLEAERPGCPLLLMTGYSGDDVSAALSGRSPHRLLRKPFQQAQLLEAVEQLLTESGARARAAYNRA